MSDGSLSQDEIDALLQGGGDDFATQSGGGTASAGGGFGGEQLQAFTDILSGIVGAQSSNLSGLLGGKSVSIDSPTVEAPSNDELIDSLPEQVVEVNLDFTEGVTGAHTYIVDQDSATTLAGLMVGQDQVELNDMALESLKEAFSTITGVALTTLGDETGTTIIPSPGDSRQTDKTSVQLPDDGIVKVTYNVEIEGESPVQLVELFELPLAQSLVSGRVGGGAAAGAEEAQPADFGGQQDFGAAQQQGASAGGQGFAGMQGGGIPGGGMQQPQGQGFGGQGFGGQPMGNAGGGNPMGGQIFGQQQPPNVQSVQFPSLSQGQGSAESGNISLLMDVYMEMTVELGRTKKSIKEILGMGEGTIIELDKLAGEPVDILVNHKLIATGEVVVIDENFGVRVTEIVSPTERMKDLT
jgi:flagellar motor switch protein FliN/FliY